MCEGIQAATKKLSAQECHRAASSALSFLLYIPVTCPFSLLPIKGTEAEVLGSASAGHTQPKLDNNGPKTHVLHQTPLESGVELSSSQPSQRGLMGMVVTPGITVWDGSTTQAGRRAPQRAIGTSSLPWTPFIHSAAGKEQGKS